MKSGWKNVSFAELITERKGRFDPHASEIRGLRKIEKIDFSQGKIHLGEYKPTKTQQIIVEPGDFVFSGLNIEKGAASFNETDERLVVSANYSTCSFDDSKVSLDFFKHYMRSENFQSLLKDNLKKDYGFTRPKHLMPLSFLVPEDKSEQQKIVDQYEQGKTTSLKLQHEIAHQEALLDKLKQAILQEAIQGKLTEDWRAAHPDTEPAAQLLKRIQKEKARLIADKKLRKEKPLPKISPAEIPFEIPENWTCCRLFPICEKTGSGSTPSGGKSAYTEEGTPFLRSQNVHNNGLVLDDVARISEEIHTRMSGTTVFPEDLLLNITGGSIGRCAVVGNEIEEANVNQHVAIIRPVVRASGKYLHSVILAPYFQGKIEEAQTGAGREGLPKNKMDRILIPLPPLAEQAAIVERVEALMENCRALEKEIEHSRAHAAHLLQAVLKEAFSPASLF